MRLFGYTIPASAFALGTTSVVLGGVCVLLLALPAVRYWSGSGDYVAASEKLSASDRSQQLRMRLEGQYPGPLQDTIIQRWRDPVDGTVCYVYLPVAVAHQAGPGGLVSYGSASIGSMSCLPPK